jgi:hypothetical protein
MSANPLDTKAPDRLDKVGSVRKIVKCRKAKTALRQSANAVLKSAVNSGEWHTGTQNKSGVHEHQ